MVNMMPNFSVPGMSGLSGGGASAMPSLGGLSTGGLGSSGLSGLSSMGGMSGIGGGAPGLDAGSLQNMGVSSSTLMLMSQINMMMASVMTGLMAFMQQVMASAAQRQQQAATAPGFTPGGSSGQPGSTGGSPGSSGGSSGGGSAPTGGNSTMQRLAAAGKEVANSMGGTSSQGLCGTGVSRALAKLGFNIRGNGNDYDSTLPQSGKFHKVNISLEEALKTPGYILTWEKTSTAAGSKYGHVAITSGDGRSSYSDFIESNTLSASGGRTGLTIWAPNE